MSDGDSVDRHVARWAARWSDNRAFDGRVEGAVTRMQTILKRLRRVDAAAFAGSGFTLEDYETLHALMVQREPTEATPAQLADATRVTRAAMTSRLDRLVDAGLVTRDSDPRDRRQLLVRPTPSGRDVWQRHVDEGMQREQHLLRALDAAELDQLNDLLRRVVRDLDGTG